MATPSIEGTYRLVRRELPDGTVQHRSYSVVWTDDQGRFYSECYAARYTLSDREYTETAEYLIIDNQIDGKGISYDLANTTAKAPVTLDGTRIRFALPQAFERALSITVEFAGDELVAKGEGQFVDYWHKVP